MVTLVLLLRGEAQPAKSAIHTAARLSIHCTHCQETVGVGARQTLLEEGRCWVETRYYTVPIWLSNAQAGWCLINFSIVFYLVSYHHFYFPA